MQNISIQGYFSSHLKDLKNGSKVIFINNKPVAVLSSINNFDLYIDEPFAFSFPEGLDPKIILDHFK